MEERIEKYIYCLKKKMNVTNLIFKKYTGRRILIVFQIYIYFIYIKIYVLYIGLCNYAIIGFLSKKLYFLLIIDLPLA